MGIYAFLRRVWPAVGPFVALLAIGAVFGLTPADLWGKIKAWGMQLTEVRIGLLLLAILSLWFAFVEWRHRGVPLTVIQTDIELVLTTENGSRATLTREEKIRANQHGVTGYSRQFGGSSGSVLKESVVVSIDHCANRDQKHIFGSARGGNELLHRFKEIPVDALMLGLNTVVRRESLQLIDAFMKDEEFYEIKIPTRYRHKKVKVTTYFHKNRPCPLTNCEAILIRDNGITDLTVEHVNPKNDSGPGSQVKLRRPRAGDRIRFIWKWPIPPGTA